MFFINPSDGKIIKANQAAADFYGYSIKSLEKMSIKDINTFTKDQVQKEMQKAKKENRNYFIFRHQLFNKEIKRVEVYSRPIQYQDKKVLFSTILDISNLELAQKEIDYYHKTLEEQVDLKSKALVEEQKNLKNVFLIGFIIQVFIIIALYYSYKKRKKAEKKLSKTLIIVEESKSHLQDIIDSFPIPIIKAESSFTHINFFNHSFKEHFGWELEDINTTDKWRKKAYPDDKYREVIFEQWNELVKQTNEANLKTSTHPILAHVRCKDNSVKLCQLWYHRNNGDIYGIFYDITKQQELEHENLEQQKMILTQAKIAAVGEMLGNIAHQWRQPLSVISSQVSGMKVRLDFGQELTEEMVCECSSNVIKQVEYLSSTIDDFKNFFTSDSESVNTFDIKNAIDKLQGLIKDSLEANHIHYEIKTHNVEVLYNENKLIQCLLNICNNAKDAMILNEIPSEDRAFFITLEEEQNNVVIKIKDSGGGVPDEIKDKIFEPYFTTKHKSIGTGIGLYMTYQLIHNSFNGDIKVSNETFEFNQKNVTGAQFKIIFPIR